MIVGTSKSSVFYKSKKVSSLSLKSLMIIPSLKKH